MEKRKRSIVMLSGLPDEILHHILSFIPTKTSVSTSAKRWRFMWTHVPNLEFYKHDFRGNRKYKQPLDIINRVIMLHEAKIVNSFTISLYNAKVGAFPLGTLIIYLIKRSVRNLYLGFGYEQNDKIVCTLPRLLLTCKTLVDLTLVYCRVISCTGDLFLPNLKKLNLSYVMYEDDKSLPHLLFGCPVLEELTIRDCFRKGQTYSGCIIVSSPTIKTLTVDFHHEGDIRSHNLEEMLIINVPALINLNLDCCDFKRIKSLRKTMIFLIAADFRFEGDWHDCKYNCNKCRCSIEFLSCLCQVKCLKITSRFDDMLVGIVRTTGSMVKFVNLTKLELSLPVNWNNVVKFLEVIDNLEVLIIHGSTRTTYNEPERVPPCMLSRLRTVRMHRLNFFYDDCENVFEMVRYILRNAQVLERMEIDHTDNLYNKGRSLDVLRKISLFERGSRSCQVAFNTD